MKLTPDQIEQIVQIAPNSTVRRRRLKRALISAAMSKDQPAAAQARIRRECAAGKHDDQLSREAVLNAEREILAIHINAMPPSPFYVRVLLEAQAIKLDGCTLGDAWESIGIPAPTGKGYLNGGGRAVNWPIWFTLRKSSIAC